ncbi:DNA polymerase III subunit chi [Methylophaga sp. OBS3]|uniref:DNA polymerase III subunit chi n=1 Tax=Methylophaga sp. OBS3 TaxID=2991934 RepID=UPI002250E4C3|nr:DNA polymerase III subunit chi [Methylophaga sp. OBS3]MCX4188920.1 DNA polymerase III subunit chi [Methylophaga sp. OBS3]
MTRVSFYLLKSQDPQSRQQFACRLAEKAWQQGHQVFIYTENAEQSAEMDKALWAFRADSFVPHQVIESADANNINAPILISHGAKAPPRLMDVLINLHPQQPLFFSQFERLAEIIDDNENIKQHGRQRYKFYQDRGYQLETHTL